MVKVVIGVTGKIGSGKTSISNYLQEKYHFSEYQFSQILSDVLERLHLKKSRENFQKLGFLLRKEWPEVIVDALEKDMGEGKKKLVVIDGIRYANELEMLKKFEKNILISVEAPTEVRYERCRKRGEKEEDSISFEEFLASEKRETEKGIEGVSQLADYHLENKESKEELLKKVDEIMEREYED